jgi:bifunctional non-homologous end joining protein LigD
MIPMLASDCDDSNLEAFLSSSEHLYELKLDGVRILATTDHLQFRSERSADHAFPEILQILQTAQSKLAGSVLDGEIIAFDDAGKPSFSKIASRLHARAGSLSRSVLPACVFMVFDVLQIGEQALLSAPLSERRALLEGSIAQALLPLHPLVRLHPALPDGRALRAFCEDAGLEGIVRKRKDSPYVLGPRRTQHWHKWRIEEEHDYVIAGYTSNKGSQNGLSALEVAGFAGGTLKLMSRVGSGFDAETRAVLHALLLPLQIPAGKASGTLDKAGAAGKRRIFVEPQVIVRVRHQGKTDDGHLRFPVFRGIRYDLALADLQELPQ